MVASTLETPSNRRRIQTIPTWWALAANRRKYANRLERLLSSVLRSELAADNAAKLYIVLSSELPAGMSPEISGAVHPFLPQHEMIRSAISKRDRGPGPVILINDSGFGRYPEWESSEMEHIAIHETAHLSTFPTMLLKTPISPAVEKKIADEISSPPITWLSVNEAFYQHGEEFIRALLHLANRCCKRGLSVNPFKLFNWSSYGYTDPLQYRSLLSSEIERRCSIRAIMSRPSPARFHDLWSREVETAHATSNPVQSDRGFLQ